MIDFIIGDVHGEAALLENTLEFARRHATARHQPMRVTFLGDLIDRGPNSKDCVKLAVETVRNYPGSSILLGNHEDMMLDAIKSRGKSQKSGDWALNGGLDTVKSYVGSIHIDRFLEDITGVYRDHLDALQNAALWKSVGPFLVVHAGYLPGTAIESQGVDALCWIRKPFLDNVDADAPLCIHGHTIIGELPVITENRISLDTGAYKTGKLTTMVYDPTSTTISFFQTHPRAGIRYVEPKLVDRGFGTLLDRSDLFDKPKLAEKSQINKPTADGLKPR